MLGSILVSGVCKGTHNLNWWQSDQLTLSVGASSLDHTNGF